MLTITRRFTFDAAHFLPNYSGPCAEVHGHTYILEITVIADERRLSIFREQGFFLDLKDLKSIVSAVLSRYDHHLLNDLVDSMPTAERLIMRLWVDVEGQLPKGVHLFHLKLHETPDSWVEYNGGDPTYAHQCNL